MEYNECENDYCDENHDSNKDDDNMDMDDLLPQVGEFGTYQKLMLWLVCLPACFPCGFGAFNQLFMADVPDHWCKVPGLLEFTEEEQRNISIPFNNNSFSKCERYAVNWTQLLEDSGDSLEGIFVNTSWPVEKCLDGWVYDLSEVSSSIVIDFDLVCDKDIYPTLGLVALNIGGPIGVYTFGCLNDMIGRKITFFMCLTTLLLGSALTITAQNFWWWAGSRIVVGLTIPAMYQIPFIISLELVGPNYRSFVTVLTCMFYTVGLMMLAGITYLVRDWVLLGQVTSIPFVLYYFYWFFLPESPRWLLLKGRFEEASKILETLAEVNKKDLPATFRQQLKRRIMHKRTKSEEERLKRNPGCSDLCGTPNMRLKTTLITINWFANETVYVGLSYYSPSLGNNEYLSFFFAAAVEIPSYLGCLLIMDRWGRRWPICMCMLICGTCCLATVTLPSDDVQATLILYLISKSAISASFLIIYPFAGELYPTQLRGFGIGTSAYIAGLGLIIIPFITYLGSEMLILPLIIMGIISMIGGILGLRLPETLHYRLPQTVEEGEEFGKDFGMKDCLRCIPIKPVPSVINSYENLELAQAPTTLASEKTPLESTLQPRRSMKKLLRQQSVMDTQKTADGTMQMTYWF
ncbi:carcinine transporter isoform X1 [Diabrotica virgifera virgifera]|uniref:Major facilitator superfamily (MFS) profile domain-containing protein n=1 Tax=Diabrotica virgifera virgifera TaxID=50390 RepID=A0ABM5IDD8_DIAVI|nr:carcinine transporter isoform X1 [Diabrotica virgifera virgifera]